MVGRNFRANEKSIEQMVPMATKGTNNFTKIGVSSNRLKPITVLAAPWIVYITTIAEKESNRYANMFFITRRLTLFRLDVYKLPSIVQLLSLLLLG